MDEVSLNKEQEIIIEPGCVKKEDFIAPLQKIYRRITKETLDYYEGFAKNQKLL